MRLGIDFGTTRTVVAAAEDGRHPVVVFEHDRGGYAEYVPGVAVLVGGDLLYGWPALARLSQGPPPDAAVRSIKREAARRPPDEPIPGVGVTAVELVAGFLRHLRWLLAHRSNLGLAAGEALEAVVAVPANASSRQRYLTLEGFDQAGFDVRGLLDEPSAGAITYGHHTPEALGARTPKRYVLVYDLGGGTFDTSAVTLRGRHFEVIATEGIGRLGGDDFDEAILRLALAGRRGFSARVDFDPVLRERLLDRCRASKERMTPHTKRIHVDLGDLPELDGDDAPSELTVDVAALHRETRPLVEATVGCIDRVLGALRSRGLDVDDPRTLGALYLVGGAVAFPPVLRRLRERYGRKVRLSSQPFAATAVGLALAADPDLDVYVRSTPTRYFGVWREGDSGREKVFDALLRKGEELGDPGVVARREYRPVHRVGRLRFLECTRLDPAGQPAGDLTPWAEVLFPYDPALFPGDGSALEGEVGRRSPGLSQEHIVETYAYGGDGRIEVVLENTTRGYRRAFRL